MVLVSSRMRASDMTPSPSAKPADRGPTVVLLLRKNDGLRRADQARCGEVRVVALRIWPPTRPPIRPRSVALRHGRRISAECKSMPRRNNCGAACGLILLRNWRGCVRHELGQQQIPGGDEPAVDLVGGRVFAGSVAHDRL